MLFVTKSVQMSQFVADSSEKWAKKKSPVIPNRREVILSEVSAIYLKIQRKVIVFL